MPDIEEKRPALLFEILRYRFEALLEDGQLTHAVRLSREHMAPLSTAHPALLPALRVLARSPPVCSALLNPNPPTLVKSNLPNYVPSRPDVGHMLDLEGRF